MRKRDGDQGGEAPLKAVPSAGPARGTCRDARVVLRLKESNLPPGVEAMTEKVCRRWPSALRRKAKPLSRAEPAAPDNRRRHAAEAGDFRLKPRLHRTRNRKFESISLQRRVGCELGSKAGPRLLSAAGTSGFAIRMLRRILTTCGPVAPPSTPTARVSMCPAELRPRGVEVRPCCLSIFGQSARCTAYLRPEHYGSGSENRY